jgi:hypothetical protein
MTLPKKPQAKTFVTIPAEMLPPLLEGYKNEHRLTVAATNSHAMAGTFEGLRLEGATEEDDRWQAGRAQGIRCRCEIGDQVRTVRVYCRVHAGGLLWVREGTDPKRQSRRTSRLTLGVHWIKAQRLQSIQDHEAIAEGVCHIGIRENPVAAWRGDSRALLAHDWLANQLPRAARKQYLASNRFREIALRGCPSPRDAFAVLWDLLHGYGAWERNPWVWVLGFRTYTGNIADLVNEEKNGGFSYAARTLV